MNNPTKFSQRFQALTALSATRRFMEYVLSSKHAQTNARRLCERTRTIVLLSTQGPQDKTFLVHINNEKFSRGATERNTR